MSSAEARAYAEQGFYLHRTPVLSDDEVRETVAAMEAVKNGLYDTGRGPEPSPWQPGDDERLLCKVEMPQLASQAVMRAVSNARLGEIAAAITGADMVQAWWVQLLIKPSLDPDGNRTANVGWHQDLQYWDCWEPDSELFTAWLALSDVEEDCGPMAFVDGSHRWGFLEQGDFFGQALDDQKDAFRLPEGATWNETVATLPPGGVSFHHGLTLHGSGPNRSGRPRRSFAIHLRTEKSRPRNDARQGLAAYIDDPAMCPILFQR